MAGLVLELQRDSLNPAIDVPSLLRKAFVIATKLNVPDFKAWIDYELNGYREASELPPYRITTGEVLGQDPWGRWLPVIFQQSEISDLIGKVRFFEPLSEIEALWHRTEKEKDGALNAAFSPEHESLLRQISHHDAVRHTRIIRAEDLKAVLDAVRNEILKWSLKLEADGISGEGMTFSAAEQAKAHAVHHTTHFHGNVGNVAQNSERFTQNANGRIQTNELARLVSELSEHLEELKLDSRQRQRAEAQIVALKTELAGLPDQSIVTQAGRTLWNITQGAIGSLVASAAEPGIWHWMQRTLSTF
jgi:hypothetical protein